MTEVTTPKTLYKYKPINEYTFASLINNVIYFPIAEQLNDPFDSQLRYSFDDSIDDILNELIESHQLPDGMSKKKAELLLEETKSKLKEPLIKAQKEVGILSLTTDYQNTVMWSHYADNHKGICIEYDCDILKKQELIIIEKIEYKKELPKVLTQIFKNYPEVKDSDIARVMFFYKHDTWNYEEEWRALSKSSGNSHCSDGIIKSITFGCNTNQSLSKAIYNLLKARGVVFFEMKTIKNELKREPFKMTLGRLRA